MADNRPTLQEPFRAGRWRVLVAAVLSTTLCIRWSIADDAGGAESPQYILVPATERHSWPEGDWTPVPRELLRQYLRQPAAAEQPMGPFIERLIFRGELHGDMSIGGDFDARISPADSRSVLELGRVAMFLGDLHWEEQVAEWGTTDDGRHVLMVPGDGTALKGRWSLAHRTVGGRIEFRVQTPPAASCRFELALPEGWRLECTSGTVIEPAAVRDGISTWIVELGRRRESLWTLERADTEEADPLLLSERSLVYSAGADRCQVHAEFSVRVLRGPVRELRFILPREFQYSKTTYVGNIGNIPLIVRHEEHQGIQHLVVPVHELAPGPLGTIEIDGTIASELDSRWRLPVISLAGAKMVRSTRRMRVEVPLAVSALEPFHLRQTDATFSETGVDWFFEELGDDSELTVQLVARRPRISAGVISRIAAKPGELRCDALVRLQTRSGSWYATEFRLPPDWEVFDVRPVAGESDTAIAYWRVSEHNGAQQLRVEFRQAASMQSPKSVLIRGRARSQISSEEGRPALVPVPVECDDCRALLIIPADYVIATESTTGVAWAEVQADRVADAWSADLDLLNVEVAGNREIRLFESVRAFETARMQLQGTNASERERTNGLELSESSSQIAESVATDDARAPAFALALKSRLSAGDADRDRHQAAFHVIAGQCSESLEFRLGKEFSLDAVLVNGTPADYSRQGDRIALARPQAEVRTIEIHYSGAGVVHGWLSHRDLRVIPPESAEIIVGFRWDVLLPQTCGIARTPQQAFVGSTTRRTSLIDRFVGPFFRIGEASAGRTADGNSAGPDIPGERVSGAAPSDSNHVTFISISPPDSLSLRLWNIEIARAYAWVAFLGATLVMLLVRRFGGRHRNSLAVGMICVSAILAASLEIVPALLYGSVFLGTVVAALVPRRLTELRPVGSPLPRRDGAQSRDRLGWTTVLLAAVTGGVGVASLTAADDDPTSDAAETASIQRRVLVPYEEGEASDVVYVDPGFARQLALWQAARDPQPGSLLRAARYFVPADADDQVRAEIDVLIPVNAVRVPVRLPISGATFSSSECLVDGMPTSLSPATDGRGMIVVVSNDLGGRDGVGAAAFRGVTFTLEFRPRFGEAGDRRETTLPSVIDSRLILEGVAAGIETSPVVGAGTSRKNSAGWDVELGPVGALSMVGGGTNAPSQPVRTDKAISFIDLRPRHALISTRLELQRTSVGPDHSIPLVLELSGFCDVRRIAAGNLEEFHVRYDDPGRTIVELVFNDREADELELDYTRPQSVGRQWNVPGIILIDNIPVSEHLVGVTTSRGLLPDTGNITDADGVQAITPETFVELVPDETGWPAPDVAYQLTLPTELPIELEPMETERSADVEQSLRVDDDRTSWQAVLSMSVAGAPATQHRIELPSSVRVESVSVVQDGAERLLSWSQDEEGLIVFLSGHRTGDQEIVLQGQCTGNASSLPEVPAIRVPESTIGRSDILIENQSGQMVELLDARGVLTGVLAPADDDRRTGDGVTSIRFDADDPDAPRHFRLQPRRNTPTLEVVVGISPGQTSMGFRPIADREGAIEWELALPSNWNGVYRVDPSGALIGERVGPDGETILDLAYERSAEVVTLAAPTSAPRGGLWTPALPTVLAADVVETFMATSPEVPFIPAGGYRARVEADAGWQAWLNALPGGPFVELFRCGPDGCALVRRADHGQQSSATTLFAETLLFSNMVEPGDGRTSAMLLTPGSELTIEVRVPEGVELLRAQFDNRLLDPEWTDAGTAVFEIAGHEPVGLSEFVMHWQSSSTSRVIWTRESVPRIIAPRVQHEDFLVVPGGCCRYVVGDGFTTMNHLAFEFGRAERLLAILEQMTLSQADLNEDDLQLTNGTIRQLLLYLRSLERIPLTTQDSARLIALREGWDRVRPLFGDEVDVAGEAVETESPVRRWDPTQAIHLRADQDLLVGTPVRGSAAWEFMTVRPEMMRTVTVAALLAGLLAGIAVVCRFVPAAWKRFWAGRDSLIGLTIIGLLWWALLPLGYLGLVVVVSSLVCETGSILRARKALRHSL